METVHGFWSYSHDDQETTRGYVEEARKLIEDALRLKRGEPFPILVDHRDLPLGERWWSEIQRQIQTSAIFFCVLSPSYVKSQVCREEFYTFRTAMNSNRNGTLVIIYLVDVESLPRPSQSESDFISAVLEYQVIDWRARDSWDDSQVKRMIAAVADKCHTALSIRQEQATVRESAKNHDRELSTSISGRSLDDPQLATSLMLGDMSRTTSHVFLGWSHTRLCEIYQDLVDEWHVKTSKSLPLVDIHVVFAHPIPGVLYKGKEFGPKIRTSLLDLAIYLASDAARKALPNLRTLKCYENAVWRDTHGFAGSAFGTSEPVGSPVEFESAFLKIPVIVPGLKNKRSFWLQLVRGGEEKTTFFVISRTYNEIIRRSKPVVSIRSPSQWDDSADAWDYFTSEFSVYTDTLNELLEVGEVDEDAHVLDMACGTGFPAKCLTRRAPKGSVTLMDVSAGMLAKARHHFGDSTDSPEVRFILADAWSGLYGDLAESSFNFIVLHLSLQAILADQKRDAYKRLSEMAAKWRGHLRVGGKFLLSLHNTVLKGSDLAKDPLRLHLDHLLSARRIDASAKLHQTIDEREVLKAFEKAEFGLEKKCSKDFERSMEDRLALWRTPAVFRSVLANPDDYDRQIHDEIINELERTVKHLPTAPMTVTFYVLGHR